MRNYFDACLKCCQSSIVSLNGGRSIAMTEREAEKEVTSDVSSMQHKAPCVTQKCVACNTKQERS